MRLHDLIRQLARSPPPDPRQAENLSCLAGIARSFSMDAGISLPESMDSGGRTLVLESGHQPNFLPYPGVWKKALLLNRIRQELEGKGHRVAVFYGFFDYDISTSPYLTGNIIPSLRKEGSERIGFKIGGSDRFRCFHTLEKPKKERWHQELDRITGFYGKAVKDLKLDARALQPRLGDLLEVLGKSYDDARTFADINAFTYARISSDWFGSSIHFFRYSDLMKQGLFIGEWRRILRGREAYVSEFNKVVGEKGLPLARVPADHVPFWYQCECNGKVPLSSEGYLLKGKCLACSNEHELSPGEDFSGFPGFYPRISPRAVSRNLMMAEGIGTHLFIAGSGGGLMYGLVADAVARALEFGTPVTATWSSRDHYLGPIHALVLRELARTFSLTPPDLVEGRHPGIIAGYRAAMERRITELNTGGKGAEIRKYSNKRYNAEVLLGIARKVFEATPSILDLAVSTDPKTVTEHWRKRLVSLEFGKSGDQWRASGDVSHRTEFVENIKYGDISKIYYALESIGVT